MSKNRNTMPVTASTEQDPIARMMAAQIREKEAVQELKESMAERKMLLSELGREMSMMEYSVRCYKRQLYKISRV